MHKVFYDAECPICVREMQLISEDNRAKLIETVPIQGNEAILAQYGISVEQALTYVHVLTDEGVMLYGMPAVRKIYEEYQGFAIAKLGNLPLLNRFADWSYPWFARHRYLLPKWLLKQPKCENGVCHLPISERTKKSE